MTRKCIVTNCRPLCESNETLTFHRIPINNERRKIWLDQSDLPPTSTGRVCSMHFVSSDFNKKSNGYHLKPNAYPQLLQIEDVELLHGNDFECETENPYDDDVIMKQEDIRDESIKVVDENAEVLIIDDSIYKEHNYSKFLRLNPSRRTRGVTMYESQHLRRTIRRLRKENKAIQKKCNKELEKFKNFSKLSPFLQELFLVLLKHHKTNSSPKAYSELLRQFALTLHYYSPGAYRFSRIEFNKFLPHPQTILGWYRVVDGSPGFTNESLQAIAELQKRTPYPIVVSIIVDGMALRRHIQRMRTGIVGYTDFGGVIPNDKLELAKEALIYHAVGVNVTFKLPVGYFLIGLTGKQLSYLTETAITLVSDCKVVVASLTFDGLKSNFAMVKDLGCFFNDVDRLITFFEVNGQKVYIFPDVCHMFKLARNFLSDEKVFLDGQNRCISWKYFEHLNNFQLSLGLHLGNKIRNLHVHYRNQIMKVYLATQLFSSSVADALEFCDQTLKLPDFRFCDGTVEFVRTINDVFDIFNSQKMTDHGYKQPIHLNNFNVVMNRLDFAKDYLSKLKHLDGTPVYAGPRKTFVVGFLTLIESLKGYYKEFVQTRKLLNFIPTYRQSQDSAEIFNGNMRSFSGFNSNPSAIMLRSAYKKSLIHVQFNEKFTGNCTPLENIPILNSKSTARTKLMRPAQYIPDEEIDESFVNAIMLNNFCIPNHAKSQAYYCIIAHMSGFIARRLTAILKCDLCSKALICENIESLSPTEDLNDESKNLKFDFESDDEMIDDNGDDFSNNAAFNYEDIGDFFNNDEDIDRNDTEDQDEGIDDNLSETEDDVEIDVGQIEEISKKYFHLIKKKDKGGLFYPSDSLYRIVILAERTFKTAVEESGGKMLAKNFTLARMVFTVHTLYRKYSDVIFSGLSNHFSMEESHSHALIENIARFYLKIRMNFLNKSISANCGKRQKLLHLTHFEGL